MHVAAAHKNETKECMTTMKGNICDSMFPTKNDLNRHIKENHKTHKPCNKFPGNRCEYDDECRYRHVILQQGQHICYKCGEITMSRTDMMNHIKETNGNSVSQILT